MANKIVENHTLGFIAPGPSNGAQRAIQLAPENGMAMRVHRIKTQNSASQIQIHRIDAGGTLLVSEIDAASLSRGVDVDAWIDNLTPMVVIFSSLPDGIHRRVRGLRNTMQTLLSPLQFATIKQQLDDLESSFPAIPSDESEHPEVEPFLDLPDSSIYPLSFAVTGDLYAYRFDREKEPISDRFSRMTGLLRDLMQQEYADVLVHLFASGSAQVFRDFLESQGAGPGLLDDVRATLDMALGELISEKDIDRDKLKKILDQARMRISKSSMVRHQ